MQMFMYHKNNVGSPCMTYWHLEKCCKLTFRVLPCEAAVKVKCIYVVFECIMKHLSDWTLRDCVLKRRDGAVITPCLLVYNSAKPCHLPPPPPLSCCECMLSVKRISEKNKKRWFASTKSVSLTGSETLILFKATNSSPFAGKKQKSHTDTVFINDSSSTHPTADAHSCLNVSSLYVFCLV